MRFIDVGTDSERIMCRVHIVGSFMGIRFEYTDPEGRESQFIWTENNDPSTYWWSDGNMACDCNRHRFLPEVLQLLRNAGDCGDEILIDSITPVEGDNLPVLVLNESA